MREAFLRQSEGKALLLPRMLSVSDPHGSVFSGLSEQDISGTSTAAIDPLHRSLLLTRLIEAAPGAGHVFTPDRAFLLAEELSRFLDTLQTEGCDLHDIPEIVPEHYAQHWQTILDFLNILSIHWPNILKSLDLLDPVAFRNKQLQLWASAWTQTPQAARRCCGYYGFCSSRCRSS